MTPSMSAVASSAGFIVLVTIVEPVAAGFVRAVTVSTPLLRWSLSLALQTVRRRSVMVRVGVPGVQRRHEGGFLVVVICHPPQDVVEDNDGFVDVRPLVEHHAFGSFAQCRITDLCPGGIPRLGELFEYLGG